MILYLLLAALPLFSIETPNPYIEANNHYLQGNIEEALSGYENVISSVPKITEAYLNAGVLYQGQGKTEQAVDALKKASKLDKNTLAIKEKLAWFAYLSGDCKTATKTAKKILKSNEHSLWGLLSLGTCLQEKEKWQKSLEPLIKLAESYPNNVLGSWLIAQSYMKLGLFEEAIASYKKVLEIDYTFLEARFPLAQALKKAGRYQEAKKFYDLVLDMDPQYAEALSESNELLMAAHLEEAPSVVNLRATPNTPVTAKSELTIMAQTTTNQKLTTKSPTIRIAIGTSSSGNPLTRAGIMFRAKGNFKIIKKASRRLLAQGKKGEVWSVRAGATKIPSLQFIRPNGKPLGIYTETILLEGAYSFILHHVPFGQGFAWAGNEDREYRGSIEIKPDEEHGLIVINNVKLEQYLTSVLASEMFPGWPMEALKAQAVIARSVAQYKTKYEKPHRNFGYHLCDGQHCQVYIGVGAERSKTRQAVAETQKEVLSYKGKAINALYHANCGGKTHAAWELPGWWGATYLTSTLDLDGPDSYPKSPWDFDQWIKGYPKALCANSKFANPLSFRWIRVISAQDLEQRVSRVWDIGSIKNVVALKRTSAGYITALKIVGTKRAVTVEKEHEIRRLLGLGQIRSNLTVLNIKRNAEGNPETIFIFGGGWGHGVGLCQAGAAGLAETKNATYQEILQHYYPEAKLEKLKY